MPGYANSGSVATLLLCSRDALEAGDDQGWLTLSLGLLLFLLAEGVDVLFASPRCTAVAGCEPANQTIALVYCILYAASTRHRQLTTIYAECRLGLLRQAFR